jgi:hypothetical protein
MPPRDARLDAIDAPYRKRAKAVLDTLQSFFIEMPRGESFCERADFQRGYDVLRRETREGAGLTGEALLAAIAEEPRAWLVLRCIIGMSPGEVAYLAAQEAEANGHVLVIDQADAREIDSRAKRGQQLLFEEIPRGRKQQYYDELLRTVVPLLADVMGRPVPTVPADRGPSAGQAGYGWRGSHHRESALRWQGAVLRAAV